MNKANLELKHRCSDFSKIRAVLNEIGARKTIIKNQKDYFFHLPHNPKKHSPRLKLRIEGKTKTLVYYERPDFDKTKGAVADIKLYSVKDAQLLPFFEAAFGVRAVVEKKREVWKLANTVFHLDTVKNVGKIFEIELQKKGKITDGDRKKFASYQAKLLPYLDEVVKGSNVDLVKESEK